MGERRLRVRKVWVWLVAAVAAVSMLSCGGGSGAPDSYSPETLLGILPADSLWFFYSDIEAMLLRPALLENPELTLDDLSGRTYGLIDAGIIQSATLRSITTGIAFGPGSIASVTILRGDFGSIRDGLKADPTMADPRGQFGPSVPLEPYRGVAMYEFPWQDDTFIAIPDAQTFLLTSTVEALQETIDRFLDGGQLDPALAELFGRVGRVDLLSSFTLTPEVTGQPEDPSGPSVEFHAFAASLNEGGTTTLHAFFEFNEEEHAEAIEELLSELPDLDRLFFRYSTDTPPEGELWREGRFVIGKTVVPDHAVWDLIQTN